MTWPTGTINTANTDQGTDNPQQARADLLALMQLVQQMLDAQPMTQTGSVIFAGTAGGTANALTATLVPAPIALVDGMHIIVRAAAQNTAAVTLNLNGIGVRAVTRRGGTALTAGAIAGSGHMLLLAYHAAGSRWELLNSYEPGVVGVAAGTYTSANVTIDAQGRITGVASGNSGFRNLAAFTAPGVAYWTVPAGITRIRVRVIGGGGGSGGVGYSTWPGGAGGGGGGYAEGYFNVLPGQQFPVTVGGGGAGGAAYGGSGGAGGTSSFYNWVSATGGAGGISHTSAGAGGNGFGGQINIAGQPGGLGLYGGEWFEDPSWVYRQSAGAGGCSVMGGGGQDGNPYGQAPGGGSAGQRRNAGVPGATGAVYIEY